MENLNSAKPNDPHKRHAVPKDTLTPVVGLENEGGRVLEIASWNVARTEGWKTALVEGWQPQILFLQEFNFKMNGIPDDYQVIGQPIAERGRAESWGNAIISKLPIQVVDIDSEYRGSLTAGLVGVDSDFKLGLINLYGLLEPSPLGMGRKVVHFGLHRMLSDVGFWLGGMQLPKVNGFIVGGDLNKDRNFDGPKNFVSGYQIASNLLNRFGDYGLKCVEPQYKTFQHRSSKSLHQIDHLFASESLTVAENNPPSSSINTTFELSDHRPISVMLSY